MSETRGRRRIDWPGALMALATVVALGMAAWMRFGPPPPSPPPAVGAVPPPLRLLDPTTREPLILLGLKGKVIWVAFWSADAPSGRAALAELQRAWGRLKARDRFAMIAVAIESDHPERLREAITATGATVPVYLATPETIRAFGASPRNVPLHLLIDEEGRVGVVAQGATRATVDRLADQAGQWLDALEPFGKARFARRED